MSRFRSYSRVPLRLAVSLSIFTFSALAQTDPAPPPATQNAEPAPAQPSEPPGGKRVFGVLPNYRTADANAVYTPITAKQKFSIGAKDSFDYPLLLLGGVLAGVGQLADQNPS